MNYTSHYNRRHNKSILVEKKSYLHILSRYIHLNPVRTKQEEKLLLPEKKKYLMSYRWSSLLGYIDAARRTDAIDYARILESYGGDNKKALQANEWVKMSHELTAT